MSGGSKDFGSGFKGGPGGARGPVMSYPYGEPLQTGDGLPAPSAGRQVLKIGRRWSVLTIPDMMAPCTKEVKGNLRQKDWT